MSHEPGPFAGLPDGVTVTHAVARHVGHLAHDVLYVVIDVEGERVTLRVALDGQSPGERLVELGKRLRKDFAAAPPPTPAELLSGPRMDPRFAALGKCPRRRASRGPSRARRPA